MRAVILALCLAGLPVADEDGTKNEQASVPRASAPVVRFSEPAQPEAVEAKQVPEPVKDVTRSREIKTQSRETKKVVDDVRQETAEMIEQVRGLISGMEKGEKFPADVSVFPPPTEQREGRVCDIDTPRVISFELERIRSIRDEAQIMLELHDKNILEIESKLGQLEVARKQLDRSREALEKALSLKSAADTEQEKERRRLRLLLSSRQMKPRKLAALMEEISVEEARVLLEALPEADAKSVLEALPAERLSRIVASSKK